MSKFGKHRAWATVSRLIAFSVVATGLVLSSCGEESRKADTTTAAAAKASGDRAERKVAVATIFPVYDFARRIGGDRFEVRMLLPPGVEAHSYEPKPSDMASLSKAALFVYTGDLMEPWALDVAKSSGNRNLVIVEASGEIALVGGEEEQGLEPEAETEKTDEHSHSKDPHVWLDPILAMDMVDAIADGMAAADPEGKVVFAANATSLKADLAALDRKIATTLAGAKRRMVIYGGHSTFGYFARRYGLEFISPYPNFSPDSEPSASAMVALLAALKKSGTDTIFYGELIEPRVARVIAQASGAKLVLLHGAHNVTEAELASGVTYLSIQESNLLKLAEALGAAAPGSGTKVSK